MIELFYAPTPNGWKIAIMLEECGLEYCTRLISLTAGEQFERDFLAINPNAKIPAIVDHDAGGAPISVFESGAILLYLAEKAGRFGSDSAKPARQLHEWLFWQASNLGPMAGQLSYFVNYAPERTEHVLNRYRGEYGRCIAVLERRLGNRNYILDDYSIADMMAFPWIFIAKNLGVELTGFPSVSAWRSRIKERPAVRRAIDLHKNAQFTRKANAGNAPLLFNQSADQLMK